MNAALGGKIAKEADDAVVIIERLAAAHEHDVRHRARFQIAAAGAVHRQNLGKDLASREVSDETAQRGRAEFTAHSATDLRGYALGVPVFILHQNALDQVPVRQTKQKLFRAVRRFECFVNPNGFVFEPREQFFAKRGRDVKEFIESSELENLKLIEVENEGHIPTPEMVEKLFSALAEAAGV